MSKPSIPISMTHNSFPLCVLCWLLCASSVRAQLDLKLIELPATFNQPVDLVSSVNAEGVLYVVEKGGRVQAHRLSDGSTSLYLDLTSKVSATSEGGLLGLAFHPAPDSNYFYVNYTAPGPGGGVALVTTISRFTVGENGGVDGATERVLLTIDQPAANHNAGDLAFGPDGYLYIPTGDGGGAGDPFDNGQNPQSLLGKLLRIDVDRSDPVTGTNYTIPADNPFATSVDTLAEIWSLGLRNPWRISFDRLTGDLWIGDVGQNQREEIDFQPAGNPGGQNYGWNCREGLVAYGQPSGRCGTDIQDYVDPIIDYPHGGNGDFNGRSVTGGFVYRGPYADLDGYYVFADFVSPRLFLYDKETAEPVTVRTDLPPNSISTFGEGNDGALYVADFRGKVYEITAGAATSVSAVADLELRIYPNPASEWLYVELLDVREAARQFILYQADGKRVGEWLAPSPTADGRYRLALPDLPAGIYTLSGTGDTGRYTARVGILRN